MFGRRPVFRSLSRACAAAALAVGTLLASPAAAGTPGAPAYFAAEPDETSVMLHWEPPVGSDPVERWEMRLRPTGNGPWSEFKTVAIGASARSFEVNGLTSGRSYDFELRAANDEGGGPTVADNATPQIRRPGRPLNVVPEYYPNNGATYVRWDGNASTRHVNAHQVCFYRCMWPDLPQTCAPTICIYQYSSRLHGRKQLTMTWGGAVHHIRVRARNSVGWGPYAHTKIQRTGNTRNRADPPTDPRATPGSGQVKLTWDDPANVHSVSYFQVRHRPVGGAWSVYDHVHDASAAREHTVTGLTDGVTYEFEVRGVNKTGRGPAAELVRATPNAAPGAPADPVATADGTTVRLAWNAPGSLGGSVHRWEWRSRLAGGAWSGYAAIPGGGATRSHVVTGLQPNADHEFEWRARNNLHAGPPAAAAVTTGAGDPNPPPDLPGAPRQPEAAAGETSVRLTWGLPADIAATDSWELRRRTAGGAWSAWAAMPGDGLTRTHVVTGLQPGAVHDFEWRARNGDGPGASSGPVRATPQIRRPDAPVNVTLSRLPGPGNMATFVLQWEPPANTDHIDSWEWRARDVLHGDVWFSDFHTAPGGGGARKIVRSYHQSMTYEFQLRARNSAGAGVATGPIAERMVEGPSAPMNPTATPGQYSVTLRWSKAPGDPHVDHWNLRHGLDGGNWNENIIIPGAARQYTVSGLEAGEEHYFEWAARNADGTGPSTGFVKATPTHEAKRPWPPVNARAIPGQTSVLLKWDWAGHTLVDDWKLRYGLDGGNWKENIVIPGASREYTVTGLQPGGEYYFEWAGRNSAGTGYSTGFVKATPTARTPGAPQQPSVSAGRNQATLRWRTPVDASPVDFWELRYREPGRDWGEYAPMPGGGALREYTVTGLRNETSYQFEWRARNGAGAGPATATFTATPRMDRLLLLSAETASVAEGDSTALEVRLSARPRSDVTLAVASDDPEVATVDVAILTFTPSDWRWPQTVTVTGVDDDDAVEEATRVRLTASGAADFAGVSDSLAVTVPDADTPALTLSDSALEARQGATATYSVRLAAEPSDQVAVAIASSDAAIATVSPASLTFTPSDWDAAQTVTVTGVAHDSPANWATVTHTASGAPEFAGVSADLEVTALLALPGAAIDAKATATGTNSVELTWEPPADESAIDSWDVRFRENRPGAQWSRPLDFAPSELTRRGSTYALELPFLDSGAEYHFEWRARNRLGLGPSTGVVSAFTYPAFLKLSHSSLTVAEGAVRYYTVQLSHKPPAPVAVALEIDRPEVAMATPTVLRFDASNWDTPQTVTVAGVEDADLLAASATITHRASGAADYAGVTASLAIAAPDDDMPGLALSRDALALAEGAGDSWTVRLNTAPAADVAVALTSSDPAVAAVSPASLTFTPLNWSSPQTVLASAPEDADAANGKATVTHLASGAAAYAGVSATLPVAVADDETGQLLLSADKLTIDEGGTASFTARLSHRYDRSVFFIVESLDPTVATVSPGYLYFRASEWNTPQTIAVTAVEDSGAANRTAVLTLRRPHAHGPGGTQARWLSVIVRDDGGVALAQARQTVQSSLAAIASETLSGATRVIAGRFQPKAGATQFTVAGERIGLAGQAPATGALPAPWRAVAEASRERTGERPGERDIAWEEFFRDSAFTMALGEADGAGWTVWGQGDSASFRGETGRTSQFRGALETGWLGMETRLATGMVMGVAFSRMNGDADYRIETDSAGEGALSTSLTAAWPYASMKTRGDGALWTLLGAGRGRLEHADADGDRQSRALEMQAAAVGGRQPVAEWRGLAFSLEGDAGLMQLETGGAALSATGGQRVEVWQARGSLLARHEGWRLDGSPDARAVAPFGSLAWHGEGGDGVRGSSAEVELGARLTARRFELEGSNRWLTRRAEAGDAASGASLTARLLPEADGVGLTLAASAHRGLHPDELDALWRDYRRFGEDSPERDDRAEAGLRLHGGYGFRVAAPHGVLSPFMEMALTDGRARELETGLEFRGGRHPIDASLSGGYTQDDDGRTDGRARLDLRLRF